MATFTAIKNRGGGRGALGGVLRYTQQDEKTLWEGQRLVTGWNCTAQSALSEMQLTKERYRKTDGRQYYHFVQSFAETDDLTPQEAHAIGSGAGPAGVPQLRGAGGHPHRHRPSAQPPGRQQRQLSRTAGNSTRAPLTSRPTGWPATRSVSPTAWRSCRRLKSRSSRNGWAPGSTAPPPRARAGSSG